MYCFEKEGTTLCLHIITPFPKITQILAPFSFLLAFLTGLVVPSLSMYSPLESPTIFPIKYRWEALKGERIVYCSPSQ
ncbi:uncharacterized protein BDR25DRAFT_347883 [Lindgomyces ingoldianus]|uniref:Uncharacterized protein n=1 Tax=Lindgomyces ingoldianus TaxID=673940 RepID=A0ACB6RGD7_9PLEO|nr:uncharacterized protein BDR25DRAFT_347883 [Lindgomyces ingoldianus]KAF2477531.1 hypothetical protein BDR25DRAFT_347883 [Lindgomyces ingoldianus]